MELIEDSGPIDLSEIPALLGELPLPLVVPRDEAVVADEPLTEAQGHFLDIMKEVRSENRKKVLGEAQADVMVIRKDAPEEVKKVADYVWEQPYAGGILHPCILPFVLVEDGLGEGEHLVQIAFETYMCQDRGDGTHDQLPYTMVLQTSLAAFVAAAQQMVQEVGAGKVPDLPFGLDLWSQGRTTEE